MSEHGSFLTLARIACRGICMPGAGAQGTIYLLRYTKRTRRGRQHYLGWAKDPVRRLKRHRAGYGATETKIAVAEGAGLMMAQTRPGTPSLERRIKEWRRARRAGFAGICPICDGRDALPPEIEAALGPGSMKRVVSGRAA
jgi:predicted GIY-YIG superfamily endonuclease